MTRKQKARKYKRPSLPRWMEQRQKQIKKRQGEVARLERARQIAPGAESDQIALNILDARERKAANAARKQEKN